MKTGQIGQGHRSDRSDCLVSILVVNSNQTSFVKGRNILEGFLILHEVVHELKTKSKRELIIKIDFEKAYDKVRWSFLDQVMTGKGLHDTWFSW